MFLKPRRNQLGNEMLLPLQLFRQEREQIETILLADLTIHLLLSEVIVELVGERFSSIESLLWRINHDLANKIEQQRVGFGKNLYKKMLTLFHSLFFTFGNL